MISLSHRALSILVATLLLAGLLNGFYTYRLTKSQRTMEAAMTTQGELLQKLGRRMNETRETYTDLRGELSFTKQRLGTTQVELRRAQQSSAQLAQQQKESTIQWSNQVGQLQQEHAAAQSKIGDQIGGLSTDVAGVKSGLNAANEQFASTRSDLQRVIGDLGVQSGLIARNRSELEELRLRGEREYYEFDLTKSKQPQRVGNVSLALRKTDLKRQRYTITLISDDRSIEKKDKTVNEPVQFYQDGSRQPSELVINQIGVNKISGYLSVPKKKESHAASLERESAEPRSPQAGDSALRSSVK